jgi:hypothetical protein
MVDDSLHLFARGWDYRSVSIMSTSVGRITEIIDSFQVGKPLGDDHLTSIR